jgi:photosystem II stability/assembly factor-like uncharacterized protein
MKLLFLFLSLAVCGASLLRAQPKPPTPQEGQSGWYKQESGTTTNLGSIFFLNKDTGWIGSSIGLFGTINAGDTWTMLTTSRGVGYPYFTDAKNGIGLSGDIIRTTDGGQIWTPYGTHPPTSGQMQVFGLDTIYIFNKLKPAFACSFDGGKTWKSQDTALTHAVTGAMSFADSKHGFLCGKQEQWFGNPPPPKGTNGAGLISTSDGGITWHDKYCPIQEDLSKIFALDSQQIYVGSYSDVFYSPDAGKTWKQVFNKGGGNIDAMYFLNTARGYVVGGGGMIYSTNDSGQNWSPQNSMVTSSLYSVIFVDSLTGWASGEDGTIIHTVNGGKSLVKQSKLFDSLAVQVFPDPVQTSILNFHYALPSSQHVTLTLFDLTGKPVQVLLLNDFEPQGEHTIPVSLLPHFANGIYIYRFQTEKYQSSGKITIIR